MRIGIDARELQGHPTGVGRYLAELLARWTRDPSAAAHELFVFTPTPLTDLRWLGAGGARVVEQVLGGSGRTPWEQRALPAAARRLPLDVFFAPAYTGPLLLRVPLLVTVHDVSFAAHPEWFSWREGFRRRLLTRLTARRARVVLTVSAFSRAEIAEHLGVPAARVRVVPSAVDSHPCFGEAPPAVAGVAERDPLVLFVGTMFNRRHVPDLIRGFARAAGPRPGALLTLVGQNRTFPPEDLGAIAEAAGVTDRLTVHEYLDEADLRALYRRASVFAFLSSYEGFGFTPLEALREGVPVVVLDTPVAREVCGEAAVYVREGDTPGLAAALGALLDDPETRARQLDAARGVLARYSWDRAARETLDALADAARG